MGRVIVLDTSVLIDQLRDRPGVGAALDDAVFGGDRLAASTVTKVELLQGMRSAERGAMRRLFSAMVWLAVDDEVAELAGRYAREYRASHHTIDVPDFIIAATAALRGDALWTRNVKHFPMFPELTSPY